jgi:hypothetical protein
MTENENPETPNRMDPKRMGMAGPASGQLNDHDNVSSGDSVSDRPSSNQPFGQVEKPSVPPVVKPLAPAASAGASADTV